MKILIVNTHDIKGGAARAAHRLHQALLEENIDSKMLVQYKTSDDFTVSKVKNSFSQKVLHKLQNKYEEHQVNKYTHKTHTLFTPAMFTYSNVIDEINAQSPDIVHLHWISKEMLGIEGIAQIKSPIVWSLHDMWAFTGGCHYDEKCNLYAQSCGKCPALNSTAINDLSKKTFIRKEKVFSTIPITVVGLSKWLSSCAQKSTLLADKKHINIPNPINTKIFKPYDKVTARKLWNLPLGTQLVLFGAIDALGDPRKGFNELKDALKKIRNHKLELVIFGSGTPEQPQDFGYKTHYLGHMYDDVSLVTLYNAVDVMVVPSLQENLSNTILESLSCGTPVVGFDIGGNSDMIEHQKAGYLAKPQDTTDLKNGIEWILDYQQYNKLCKNAREKVVKEFDSVVVAKRYITLYEEVVRDKLR